jgi:hypothetical protein
MFSTPARHSKSTPNKAATPVGEAIEDPVENLSSLMKKLSFGGSSSKPWVFSMDLKMPYNIYVLQERDDD